MRLSPACLVALGLLIATGASGAEKPAKELFGAVALPTAGPPHVIGSYAKGCIAGAAELPATGDGYQAMRPSRHRAFGDPVLIDWIERFAQAAQQAGWPGLLVGDMAQPRGGPMRTGHASHQLGLDVDLWLTPAPDHVLDTDERETMSAVSMLRPSTREVDPAIFGAAQLGLIHLAARTPEVARIFVHPGIKRALCTMAGTDRDWLRKVRPWYGHDAHFHVRLSCPADQPDCTPQEPPPPGDGCGDELAYWFTEEAWKPSGPPPPPLTLAQLPEACAAVLAMP